MIQQYINSGILEAYVTGSASDQEVNGVAVHEGQSILR
jgi:hypothetical protein